MFIIFGSRSRTQQELYVPDEFCVVCYTQGIHIVSVRSWFTLFFIPIFPISSKDLYFYCDECRNCYTAKNKHAIENIPQENSAQDIQ